MDDDAEVWKKILVAMPKAIGEMVKMSKDIDGAKKDLGRYEETAKLLIERAKARNKMSSQSRDDLLGALEELQKAVGKVSKFTNEEAVRITRFADPVFDLEEKLRGRTHEKDIRAMHEKVIAAGKLEGSLRDRLTEVVTQVAEAEALIKQTVKTVERIKDMMETRMTMFWDSPVGGAKTLNDTLLDVKQRVKAILGADPLKLDESAKRQLVQAMRKLDNERLQLDSNITNLGNILRSVVSETKQFTSDKKIVEQIKEMAATYNLLNGEYKKIDVDIAKADKKIQEMAG
jgi:predicted  nucleic acid-binding Zn-ribbon protein